MGSWVEATFEPQPCTFHCSMPFKRLPPWPFLRAFHFPRANDYLPSLANGSAPSLSRLTLTQRISSEKANLVPWDPLAMIRNSKKSYGPIDFPSGKKKCCPLDAITPDAFILHRLSTVTVEGGAVGRCCVSNRLGIMGGPNLVVKMLGCPGKVVFLATCSLL